MTQPHDEIRSLVAELAKLDGDQCWRQTVELGLVGVGINERDGGSGGTLADVLVLVEEFAANGVSTPILEASFAQWVLTTCRCSWGTASQNALHTIVFTDDRLDVRGPLILQSVPWARRSARVVVIDSDGRVLAADVSSAALQPGHNLAGEQRDRVTLSSHARGEAIGHIDVSVAHGRFSLLWSAALLGAAKGAYELTKRYVRQREQFGAALIKIPAVATSLALMRTHVLQAQAAVDRARAIHALPDATGAVTFTATAIARIMTSACADEVARLAHQLHGAIGTTEEYPLHLFTQRLWAWRDADRPSREWAALLAREALDGGERGIWDDISVVSA
jgi:acyl-CoA dehydrogenase